MADTSRKSSTFGGSSPSSTAFPLHANGSSPNGSPQRKKRDMDDFYQRKVDNCDKRIKRLEAHIKEMEAAEQRARERSSGFAAGHSQNSAAADGGAGSSPKRLNKESEDKMIQRLTYIKERDSDALFPPIDNTRPAKQMWAKLKPDYEDEDEDAEIDVEAMVERLGVQDVDMRNEHTETRLEDVEANGVNAMWRESIRQISIARRRRTEEEVDEDEDDEELYVLSEEKMEALGSRLCRESLDHRKQVMADLEQKYYGPDANKSIEIERSRAKRLKEGVKQPTPKELGARLHDESMSKKRTTMAELEARYIEPNNLIRTKTGELKALPKLSKDEFNDMVNRLSKK